MLAGVVEHFLLGDDDPLDEETRYDADDCRRDHVGQNSPGHVNDVAHDRRQDNLRQEVGTVDDGKICTHAAGDGMVTGAR